MLRDRAFSMSPTLPTLQMTPIGVVHSPWQAKHSAPRQPAAAVGVQGTIEIFPHAHPEHSLEDIALWSHLWVLFWFHQDITFRSKVQPPRSGKRRGVFATRSPHRPNPIGLSVVRLLRVEGSILHISDIDMLDGTPVFDIKPYVPYADVVSDAGSGWLAQDQATEDPGNRYEIEWSPRATEQLAWLTPRTPFDLRAQAEEVLRLGPAPHAYRRIKDVGTHLRLGLKDFRVHFTVSGTLVHVLEIDSGYKLRVLKDPQSIAKEVTPLAVHRELVETFFPQRR
jgi:tRNA-Thr(GGU) m(6)t(6)A37 methyltransferase TsaA